jgi:hypothetical protein
MQAFRIVRLAVFGVALGFSLILLGIGANFVAQTAKYRVYGGSIPGFAVATAVLTFAIIIPVLVIDFLRKGAMTSLTASELGFMGFLWILWLACASNATAALGGYTISDCSLFYDSAAASLCQQYQALQAFSWLGWLVLFFYWIALLVIALIAQTRGVNNAFMTPSTELAANLPKSGNAGGEPKIPPANYPPGSITPGTYPPQGQFPPGQYPQQGYSPAPMASQGHAFQPSYASSPAPAPPPPNTIHV